MTKVESVPESPEMSPLQRDTLAMLRRGDEPVTFDPAFVASIRTDIEESFTGFHERMGKSTIFMTKHRIASALGCEVQHMNEDEFVWKPAVAGGQIAHRAIQLLLNWRGDPSSAELVDEAIARLSDEERGLGDWIAGQSQADIADLRSIATDKVIKFRECFPPIDQRYAPTTESSIRWPVEGPIVLSGRSDLTIGRAIGSESRKVIIDLKAGRVAPAHREDLRFYALIETLRTHVPPRKLASFYLAAGSAVVEDVTERVLLAASRRTLDAIDAEIALTIEKREPVKRPGASCNWCPLLGGCAEGSAHIDQRRTEAGFEPAELD